MKTILMLDCFPYPEYVPEEKGEYLVNIVDTNDVIVGHYSTNKGRWSGAQVGKYFMNRIWITAWAEMPERLVE